MLKEPYLDDRPTDREIIPNLGESCAPGGEDPVVPRVVPHAQAEAGGQSTRRCVSARVPPESELPEPYRVATESEEPLHISKPPTR
jgi:hypothetical protein